MRYYINVRRYSEALGVQSRIGLRGRFTVELVHGRTGFIKRRLEFSNLIVDSGLDYLIGGDATASLAGNIARCAVSTDNAPPDVSDTELAGEVVSVTRTHSTGAGRMPAPDYTVWCEREYLFELNEANANLAKVAIMFNDRTLWAVQLFRDEAGNPTVITKTSEDKLRVTYRLSAQPLVDDLEYTLNIVTPRNPNGTVTDVTTRPVGMGFTQGAAVWLTGNSTSNPGLGNYTASSSMGIGRLHSRDSFLNPTSQAIGTDAGTQDVQPYTTGSHYREIVNTWRADQVNYPGGVPWHGMGGYSGFTSGQNQGGFQSLFAPAIDKTDEDRLVIGHRISFARLNDA